MASGDTLMVLPPLGSVPPSSSYATFDTRNGHPCLDYDAATDESAIWTLAMPAIYGGGGITITLVWSATSATSGNVVWAVSFERINDEGLDIDADSFDTAQTATGAAPGTSGQAQYTDVAFTNGQIDGLLAGETFRVRVTRDADNGSDTMSGDAELLNVIVSET